MMRTDDLIAALLDDLRPVPKGWVARQIILGTGLGVMTSAILMIAVLGLRADLTQVASDWQFHVKVLYTLALTGIGLWLVARQGRPGADASVPMRFVALPVFVIVVLAGSTLAQEGADTRLLIMGRSALFCPFAILALALPVLVGTMWALRRLAPVRPIWAGASAGFLAGSVGALVYSFYCTENAVPFVAAWYSLGIGLSGLLGAIIGRTSLRW